MIKKLSPLDLHVAIKRKIEENTSLRCVDDIGLNEPSPFAYLDIIGMTPRNTKTMFIDEWNIHVHVLSAASDSSIEHYANLTAVQEAFTEELELPEPYNVFGDPQAGLIRNFKEETGERHAVWSFIFKISYGFKIK